MSIELVVRDRTPGREDGELTLVDLPQRLTLRDLIRTRVRDEVVELLVGVESESRASESVGVPQIVASTPHTS